MGARYSFQNGWQVLSALGEQQSHHLCADILDDNLVRQHVFRDNWRTLSANVRVNDRSLLLKIPRARNGRRWERILTMFRGSDALRSFRHLEMMSELGLSAPEPVLAAEFRSHGMVTDSFVCYDFVEGRRPDIEDAPAILDALRTLHGKGYLRNDAQLANFLIRGCPEARSELTQAEASSIWFRLAHALENLSFARRRWKRYFRDRRKARAGHRS
jgi:heptose II phosphotransferase